MAPDSSEDEWEEVEDLYKPEETEVKHSDNVEVELDLPDAVKKKQKKKQWERETVEAAIRRAAKKYEKETQIAMHKVHLLCLLSVGMKLNRVCNGTELKARIYSLIPERFAVTGPKDISGKVLERLADYFTKMFDTPSGIGNLFEHGLVRLARLESCLKRAIEQHKLVFKLDLVLLFVLLLRSMGLSARLVLSLQPVSFKVPTKKQKDQVTGSPKKSGKPTKASPQARKRRLNEGSKLPQVDGAGDKASARVTRSQAKRLADGLSELTNSLRPGTKKTDANTYRKSTAKVQKTSSNVETLKLPSVTLTDEDTKKYFHVNKTKKLNAENQEIKSEPSDKSKVPVVKKQPEARKRQARRKRKSSVIAEKNIAKPKLRDDTDDENFKPNTSDSESDFEVETKKKTTSRKSLDLKPNKTRGAGSVATKSSSPRQKSASSKSPAIGQSHFNEWLEVYSQQDNKWMCIDLFRCTINRPENMERYATSPLHYVLAFDGDGSVKDVTARYAAKWLTETRKLRIGSVDKDYWKQTLSPYRTTNLELDSAENEEMQRALLSQPIPTTISAFKDHPLFALRRHLLKYQAIYPPDVPAVGLVRGEEIYPRSAIYTLHSRDKWLQQARSVRDGEEPFKMVASLWTNWRLKQDMATLSMPLFGIWQTESYVPPVAKDGKVPRNQYGNVDLFQPSMMPVGCVQLRLAGLHKVARKLDIDVAQAITGFDSQGGFPYPVTDGYIVCKEHEEVLVAAWNEDQIHAEQREKEKREQRVYGHWKLLIKGLLAGERVKRKYSSNKGHKATEVSADSGVAWQAKRLEVAKAKARQGRKKRASTSLPYQD